MRALEKILHNWVFLTLVKMSFRNLSRMDQLIQRTYSKVYEAFTISSQQQ